MIKESIERLARIADEPGNSDERRLQHRFLIATGVVMSAGGLLWGVVGTITGLYLPSLIPFGYVFVTILNFYFLFKTKNFRVARNIQILISIVLPFVFQWSLGGLFPSGGSMLWSMLCLSAAQAFGDRASSLRWLVVFVLLTLISIYVEAQTPIPMELFENREMIKLPLYLFTMNFLAVSLAIYALISIFMRLRRQMGLELVSRTQEVADSQRALMQSEKMAALGRLSAGMAHELNNPAAAAARGAKQLRQSIRKGWQIAIELAEIQLSPEQTAILADFEKRIESRLKNPPSTSTLERMDLEEEIQAWLKDRRLTAELDAALLLESGLDAKTLDELSDAFPDNMLPAILRLVTGLHERESLARQVTRGTERISVLVQTLKSYTYMDRAKTQPTDVNAGIEDTLIMLQGELKRGIAVNRQLDPDLPCIEANGGELNQVWTNIISNAADAMSGQGELEVTSRHENGEIIVTIVDTGPGIPTEVRETLFEPFVTTKPVGKGTGLGLNVSRNIIADKHGGSISVTSKPGRTCFEIRLPMNEVDCPPEIAR